MGFLGGGKQFDFLKNKSAGSKNIFSPDFKSSSSPFSFGISSPIPSKVSGMSGINPADLLMKKNPFEQEKKGNFLSNFISDMPKFGTDKEGKSFLDRFKEGYSYRPKEESGQEQFYGELAKRMGTSGMVAPVAEGLTLTQNETGSPIVAQGTPGSPGLLQTVGVPLVGAFLCDIKAKEDIAPLCTSEINDVLSECAYFVKDLNECS